MMLSQNDQNMNNMNMNNMNTNNDEMKPVEMIKKGYALSPVSHTEVKITENTPFTVYGDRKYYFASEQEKQGTELEFVIMVIAVSCVKLLSAHNSTQHTSRKHKV
jgi:YHS domain.